MIKGKINVEEWVPRAHLNSERNRSSPPTVNNCWTNCVTLSRNSYGNIAMVMREQWLTNTHLRIMIIQEVNVDTMFSHHHKCLTKLLTALTNGLWAMSRYWPTCPIVYASVIILEHEGWWSPSFLVASKNVNTFFKILTPTYTLSVHLKCYSRIIRHSSYNPGSTFYIPNVFMSSIVISQ